MSDQIQIETRFCGYCEEDYEHPMESEGGGWHEPFLCKAQ